MGAALSYFARKPASSRIDSDPFLVPSASAEGMAEGNPRYVTRQQSHEWISQDDFRRYANALQDTQEFLNNGVVILERQRNLQSELETCQERLRRLTEDHARASESGTENISSSNRPSALERNYEQFYDHERMDAIDCIENSRKEKEQNKWTEIEDQRVACTIFEESFSAAQFLKENCIQGLSSILTSALSVGAQYANRRANESDDTWFNIKTDGRQCKSLCQSSLNSLKVILKETAETNDVHALIQITLDALYKRQDKGRLQHYKRDIFAKPEMKKYVEKCCRYAWKLVCQTPPYIIDGNSALLKSNVFDPSIHQVSREFASPERSSGVIKLVVWPGLFEGSSHRVIRKTEVVLQSL